MPRGGETVKGGDVAHDLVQGIGDSSCKVLIDLQEVAVEVGELIGLRILRVGRPDGLRDAGCCL